MAEWISIVIMWVVIFCGIGGWFYIRNRRDPPPTPPDPKRLHTRQRVCKVGGSFQHTGVVVAKFNTLSGEPRIVLEFAAPVDGMLHIYRPDQVRVIDDKEAHDEHSS